jgi:DNA repair ATPase RecN
LLLPVSSTSPKIFATQQKIENSQQKEYVKKRKLKDRYDELHAKVEEIKRLNLPPDKWNTAQLRAMVKWYKQDSDE